MRPKWPHIPIQRICVILLSMMHCVFGYSQKEFTCESQLWMLEEGTERLVQLEINPSNNAIIIKNFIADVEGKIDAIAFNHGDSYLYGIHAENHDYYRIYQDGTMELVTKLALTPGLEYRAMVFNKFADKLILIGSINGEDESIEIVDINTYDVEKIILTGNIHVSDFAVDPITGLLYAYNFTDEIVIELDLANLSFRAVAIAPMESAFQGVYFDSFGVLYAFGSTANGVASALFKIDKNTTDVIRIATGPESVMRDFANCPYRVDMQFYVHPILTLPCSEIECEFRISNSSLELHKDLEILAELRPGFKFKDVNSTALDGDISVNDNVLRVNKLELSTPISSFTAKIEVGDIPGGVYSSQAMLTGLPEYLGSDIVSDNPRTNLVMDPTAIEVKRIDEDSIFVKYFFCRDDDPVIDGSQYGTNLRWQDGSTNSQFTAPETGTYYLESISACKTTVIVFNVTIANCPYNIKMDLSIEPDTIFPCSTTNYYFLVDNDTGNDYNGIEFLDTLPAGFEFKELVKNPYGGELDEDLLNDIIHISDMRIPNGRDTIIIRVEVGDLNPDTFPNRAVIMNFPSDLGKFRVSDNPKTLGHDDTNVIVLGVDSDSSYQNRILCVGESILLDGSSYGNAFEWFDGSTEATVAIDEVGVYELQVFTGCETSYVFFDVEAGDDIQVEFDEYSREIHLGDSLQLFPIIQSQNATIELEWFDPQDTTISCINCLSPFVRPYFDNVYTIKVENGVCSDSAFMEIIIEKTRKIYAPNIFDPGLFDENGDFFLQSPDFARLKEFVVFDRWGTLVFESRNTQIEDQAHYWDGYIGSRKAPQGVYVWKARIEFLDGVEEIFYGNVSLLR